MRTRRSTESSSRGGDADEVAPAESLPLLHDRIDQCSWVGISFVEEGKLVLGPALGELNAEPTAIPISYEDNVVAELGVVASELGTRRPHIPRARGGAHSAALPRRLGHGRRSLVSLGHVTCLAPVVVTGTPAVRRPA